MMLTTTTEAEVRRELLRLALHNAGRSVWAQAIVVSFIVWLGWRAGEHLDAIVAGAIGYLGTAWRWWLSRHYADTSLLDEGGVARASRMLEGNAATAGAFWVASVISPR
mgnify:CR=1 FL=1